MARVAQIDKALPVGGALRNNRQLKKNKKK